MGNLRSNSTPAASFGISIAMKRKVLAGGEDVKCPRQGSGTVPEPSPPIAVNQPATQFSTDPEGRMGSTHLAGLEAHGRGSGTSGVRGETSFLRRGDKVLQQPDHPNKALP